MRLTRVVGLVAAAALLGSTAGPAVAHHVYVHGEEKAFAGGGPLPAAAQGQGLIPGGGGAFIISPAHAKGLVTACYALRSTGAAVDIWGPANPATCEHGPPAP